MSIPIDALAYQSKAARAWLKWSQDDLAMRANLSRSTIAAFESNKRLPRHNDLAAIFKAFADEGMCFDYEAPVAPRFESVVTVRRLPI
jgi:transcriptional regulator with XRE-family HTH domain